ncbi:MAG: VWA domain-containing protein [Gammaproteobacteria bacterium]|nr:MAG: VWA domain-containing protein [Gammaproteobacteria bacterium]
MVELLASFHFSKPVWLWALLLCVPVALWLVLARHLLVNRNQRIQQYADAHLLPHLLGHSEASSHTQWLRFARWTAMWTLLVLAMAGPRWDFTDVQLFRPGTNLVVLFDISRSMNVADVQPTRLARARQELEDLLNENRGIRVGLIGFASVAHVVSPVTEDMNGIRRVLSALDTSLVQLQGSRPSFALQRASELIAGQPEDSVSSLLIITDGDFDEQGLEERMKELAAAGIRVHILGVGTQEGDAVPGRGRESPWIMNRSGQPVISSLNEPLLKSMAKSGNGIYLRADYRGSDTREILARVKAQALPKGERNERTRVWNERFYWLAGLALVLLLPLFRRTLPEYRPRNT